MTYTKFLTWFDPDLTGFDPQLTLSGPPVTNSDFSFLLRVTFGTRDGRYAHQVIGDQNWRIMTHAGAHTGCLSAGSEKRYRLRQRMT